MVREGDSAEDRRIPVLVAVSQATLDKGSSLRQASRIASETWSLENLCEKHLGVALGGTLRNLIRMTLTDRFGGEKEDVCLSLAPSQLSQIN